MLCMHVGPSGELAGSPTDAERTGTAAALLPGDGAERIKKLGMAARRSLTKYWIFISAGILLMISLREP